MKTLSTKSIEPRKDVVGVGGGSRARRDGSELDGNKINGDEIDSGEVGDDKVGKKVQKLSKSKNLFKFKKTVGSNFFIPGARLAFTKLRQAFIKVSILYHFDLEYYIRIETDILGYAIGEVLSQLNSNNLG